MDGNQAGSRGAQRIVRAGITAIRRHRRITAAALAAIIMLSSVAVWFSRSGGPAEARGGVAVTMAMTGAQQPTYSDGTPVVMRDGQGLDDLFASLHKTVAGQEGPPPRQGAVGRVVSTVKGGIVIRPIAPALTAYPRIAARHETLSLLGRPDTDLALSVDKGTTYARTQGLASLRIGDVIAVGVREKTSQTAANVVLIGTMPPPATSPPSPRAALPAQQPDPSVELARAMAPALPLAADQPAASAAGDATESPNLHMGASARSQIFTVKASPVVGDGSCPTFRATYIAAGTVATTLRAPVHLGGLAGPDRVVGQSLPLDPSERGLGSGSTREVAALEGGHYSMDFGYAATGTVAVEVTGCGPPFAVAGLIVDQMIRTETSVALPLAGSTPLTIASSDCPEIDADLLPNVNPIALGADKLGFSAGITLCTETTVTPAPLHLAVHSPTGSGADSLDVGFRSAAVVPSGAIDSSHSTVATGFSYAPQVSSTLTAVAYIGPDIKEMLLAAVTAGRSEAVRKPLEAINTAYKWFDRSRNWFDNSGNLTSEPTPEEEQAAKLDAEHYGSADVFTRARLDLAAIGNIKYRSAPLPMELISPTTVHATAAETSVLITFSRDDPSGRTPAYAQPVVQEIPADPTRMVVADLTGHHRSDVVLLMPAAHGVGVALAKPDGSGFEPVHTYVTGNDLTDVAVGDVNGDGAADIVVSSRVNDEEGMLTTLLNDGHGEFHLGPTSTGPTHYSGFLSVTLLHAVKGEPLSAAVGVTPPIRDGRLFPADVMVMKGDGTGHFAAGLNCPPNDVHAPAGSPSDCYVIGGTYALPTGLLTRDMNGDGRDDIVVLDAPCWIPDMGHIKVLLNKGNGSFEFAPEQTDEATGHSPNSTVACMMSHAVIGPFVSERPDIVISEGNPLSDTEGHHVNVFPNRGDGGLLAPLPIALPLVTDPATGKLRPSQYTTIGGTAYAGGQAALLAARTADLSGRPEVCLVHTVEGGVLGDPQLFALTGDATVITTVDLNGDGMPDIVYAGGGELGVLLSG